MDEFTESLFSFKQYSKDSFVNKNKNREVNRLDLESLKFYDDVRNTFLELSKKYKDRYVVIDASKSLDEVVETTYKIIKEKLDGLR